MKGSADTAMVISARICAEHRKCQARAQPCGSGVTSGRSHLALERMVPQVLGARVYEVVVEEAARDVEADGAQCEDHEQRQALTCQVVTLPVRRRGVAVHTGAGVHTTTRTTSECVSARRKEATGVTVGHGTTRSTAARASANCLGGNHAAQWNAPIEHMLICKRQYEVHDATSVARPQ